MALILMLEGFYARYTAAAGSWYAGPGYRLLLCLSGLTLALVGLLVLLRSPSVARLVRGTPHPRWDGATTLWGGLCFAALYGVQIFAPLSLRVEIAFLFGIVESVVLLWLVMWARDRRKART